MMPRCSFSSRRAFRTASTTLSVAEPPDPPPLVERASAEGLPRVRGAVAAGGSAGPAAVRATVAGAAPGGGGKEISMKSGPERTSAPAA